ncbi:hypothetical protein T492DRAFT_612893, partial [Pavlovales sp. CCMP2436]
RRSASTAACTAISPATAPTGTKRRPEGGGRGRGRRGVQGVSVRLTPNAFFWCLRCVQARSASTAAALATSQGTAPIAPRARSASTAVASATFPAAVPTAVRTSLGVGRTKLEAHISRWSALERPPLAYYSTYAADS